MTDRGVTYADLDALLKRVGLKRRTVEIDRGARIHGENGVDATAPTWLVPTHVYSHAKSGAVLMLPVRPWDNVAMPHHVHAARRTLVDWDVISNVEFDRWLCQMRFPDDCAAPVSAHDRARATG